MPGAALDLRLASPTVFVIRRSFAAPRELVWRAASEGRTEVTIRTECASQADRDALLAMGVEGGWTEAFERLDACLAAA